ncbi:DUF1176 domain-containing protein [uncultured Stenotrophomonas sp.]|uniref:DUF1176 domain-containing protein n=1 Tax=uncultured Stenotrophomonas sp. TaxID=165438 RepID=UPI0028E2D3D1|nr:DUF1176 domain-containing protein [uncultured Stenotrophomonas sp.]
MRQSLLLLILAGLSPAVSAAPAEAVVPGIDFGHEDWTLACDNTRTCRAAGYQRDDGESEPVSILLTRNGGPDQPVRAELMLGEYDEGDLPTRVTLRINEKALGTVDNGGPFSVSQVAALLKSLVRDSRIELLGGKDQRWVVSDKGASAVLLKMDEFQGRLGTPGALMRKGVRAESSVPPALPVPVITLARKVPTTAADTALGDAPALRAALVAATSADDCDALNPGEGGSYEGPQPIRVQRLSRNKLLASTSCWRGAYNTGEGYWVINDHAPYQPTLVTNLGGDDDTVTISAANKGRGLGDCWSTASWGWTGTAYVQTSDATTGLCRLVAAGGAWQMPTLVTEVREP